MQKTLFDTLIVVKRSGQRTSFQGEKIAMAIQKAFRSIDIPYKDEDVNKVYSKVLVRIDKEYQDRKTINIENIQDLIEEVLKKEKFEDVYQAFSTYREHRNASRGAFVMKQQHKFLKAIERLGLNNLEENITTSPNELRNKFGNTIAAEFAKAYLLDTKTTRYHDAGVFFIHSIETIPFGSIESIDLDLSEVLKLDTPFAHALKQDEDIRQFLTKLKYFLDHLKEEVYHSISFVHFDKDLTNIVLKEYKRNLLDYSNFFLEISEFSNLLSISKSLEKVTDFIDSPSFFQLKENTLLYLSFQKVLSHAKKKTEENLEKALSTFFQSFTYPVAFNFGGDDFPFSKTINHCLLKTITNRKNVHYFFQIKQNILSSLLPLEEAITHSNLYLVYMKNSINKQEESVSYGYNGRRVIEDNTTTSKKLVGGKGVLATVSLNLTRIALKYRKGDEKREDIRSFYQEVENALQLAKDALLERFEIEVSKSINNFPHLYQYGSWHDGERMRENDRLRKLLKHGTLAIHFTGLKEAVIALAGEYDQTLAKNIVLFMKKKLDIYSDENNLNFVLTSIKDPLIDEEFKKQDTAIFGKIKGITDKEKYTSGVEVALQKYILGGDTLEVKAKTKEALRKKIEELKKEGFLCLHVKQD